MRVLLDSEVIVWMIYSPDRLTSRVVEGLQQSDTELFVSHATLWEVLAKIGRGKLLLAGTSVEAALRRIVDLGVEFLPVTIKQIVRAANLPQHHHDPFDRLIIAQAIEKDLVLFSSDRMFSLYAVTVIW